MASDSDGAVDSSSMNTRLPPPPQQPIRHANTNTNQITHRPTIANHNDDDNIESDSSDYDYDNPYQETAWDWHRRHVRRIARRRCGLDSSDDEHDDSGDSLDEDDGETKHTQAATRGVDGRFWKWMQSYPLMAARCCLSSVEDEPTDDGMAERRDSIQHSYATRRRTVREREAKKLRRMFRSISNQRKDAPWNYRIDTQSAASTLSEDEQRMKYHQLVIDSILPKGLGISFIDAVLAEQSNALTKQTLYEDSRTKRNQKCTFCRVVLEISGPARSGMTSILLALAARYVANTSSLFLQAEGDDHSATKSSRAFTNPDNVMDCAMDPSHPEKLQPNNRFETVHSTTSSNEPRAVILDLEHGVHTVKLILSVREAVLCRWEETSLARKWNRQRQATTSLKPQHERVEPSANGYDDAKDSNIDAVQEQRQIERAIASCLGRIHIIQPWDFSYLSLVATIESINNQLNHDKLQRQQTKLQSPTPEEPPMLLLIDSLTTLDACTRAQENLPTASGTKSGGSGLSERNEFYRQLVRLREDHEVAIVGAARRVPKIHKHAGDSGEGRMRSIWDKMVTQRVALHHVAEGTAEEKEGFSFVATIKSGQGDSSVCPYSITRQISISRQALHTER